MQTFTALEVIACPKTLLLRCKLKVQLPKNPGPRSLDLKIQSRSIGKPPLRPASINQGKSSIKIRRKNILRKSGTKKTLFRPQGTTPLRVRRSGTIETTESAIIVKKGPFCQELPRTSKKLVSVLATSVPVTGSDEEVNVRVLCIHYPVQFQEEQIKALFDSGSKVNAINPDYAQRLRLKIQKTNIRAQKIDGSTLKTFAMIIADFQVENKANRPRFFQEIFLMADTIFEVILGMLFLKISNMDISFGKETLM